MSAHVLWTELDKREREGPDIPGRNEWRRCASSLVVELEALAAELAHGAVTDEAPTYRDGTGHERCATCLRALRDVTDAPLTPVRVSDLEAAVRALTGAPGYEDLVERLRSPLGLNLGQVHARECLEALEEGYGHGV